MWTDSSELEMKDWHVPVGMSTFASSVDKDVPRWYERDSRSSSSEDSCHEGNIVDGRALLCGTLSAQLPRFALKIAPETLIVPQFTKIFLDGNR